MECPNCNKELNILPRCWTFLDQYRNYATAKTLCCDTLVDIRLITTYEVSLHKGDKKEDDWGK